MGKFGVFIWCCLLAISVEAKELKKAQLVKVSDGDTIQVLIDNRLHKIRLLEIDCYESSKNQRAKLQASYYNKSLNDVLKFGRQSKFILQKMLKQNQNNLYVALTKKDRFKRDLAYVYIGKNRDIDVNSYMLNFGKCERYVSSYQMRKKQTIM